MLNFIKISDYKNNRLFFSDLVYQTYQLIDCTSVDYKDLHKWYLSEAVPEIFAGKVEFFLALLSDELVGVLIAKNTSEEHKVCTLFVFPKYRNNGIASHLLQNSFIYFGTKKPIITFNESNLGKFKHMMKKYGWHIDDKIYNSYSRNFELVCNTKK